MRARRSSHATKLVRGIPRATGYGSAFGAGRSLGPRVRRRAFSGLPPRPRGRSILLTLGVLLSVLLLTGVVVVTATAGAVGVAAVATVNMLSTDLPDPKQLDALTFSQPTVVYDRTGKIELGRFQREQRSVVSFDRIPKLVLDSTVTAEDRSFWTNAGYDPTAILGAVAENVSGAGDRGASTITQQLVRARLLPQEYVEPGADRYLRKAKELVQSARVTQAFPGEPGKERIITAYLNEIFYGHDAYGIAAAARTYFGVDDLAKLTPAQSALLAGLPQAPTVYDPYRYARPDAKGRLVVDPQSPPVQRRNFILDHIGASRWTRLTPAQLTEARSEPVVLKGDQPLVFRAPHFTWQVRRQLDQILGGTDKVETGGYTVITTLDWTAQQKAEKWEAAAVIAPNLKTPRLQERLLNQLRIPRGERAWIHNLRGKDLHNSALVALDYRTGDVVAYAGSAGYYQDKMASREFNPKYDAAGDGARQPGSAWKPILYATAFEQHALTPGSLLLDVTTRFSPGSGWIPRDADNLDRGPVLVRRALQYSLNVPAIRALERVGTDDVARQAIRMGIRFANGATSYKQAGLAGAIGTVEVRPLDLTAAFGVIGNGGVRQPARMILEIRDPTGKVVYKAPNQAGTRVLSAGSAFLVSNILQGNTDPRQNPIWAAKLRIQNGPHGAYRPLAAKTGTANDARDLATYGFLPPPKDRSKPAYAIGIWMGNSDHSTPRTAEPVTSLTAAAPLWRAFVSDLTRGQPVATFKPPRGVVRARIDAWSGGAPGPWTRKTTTEWFLAGTEPGGRRSVDPAGLLYSPMCGGWRVDPLKAEVGPRSWDFDVANWMARARGGPGVDGPLGSRTAFFWGESSWGGPLAGACPPPPRVIRIEPRQQQSTKHDTTKPAKPDKPGKPTGGGGGGGGKPGGGGGNGNGNGNGNGHGHGVPAGDANGVTGTGGAGGVPVGSPTGSAGGVTFVIV